MNAISIIIFVLLVVFVIYQGVSIFKLIKKKKQLKKNGDVNVIRADDISEKSEDIK